mmetsp:Transcript_4389/g.9485  ORF Transcript_4389/g.9485 Transcript_4389/m.9485 type:complete len:237 (-) Transcript_4389:281-991(-)
MRVHLQLAAVLLESAHEGASDLLGATDGHAVVRSLLEEAVEDVEDVRGHSALGRESAEDAHRVDPIAEEGLRHNLVDGLVERLEDERQVGEDPWFAHHKGRAAGGRGKEAGVLSEVHERDSGHGAAEVFQPCTEGLPLLDREVWVLRMLAQHCTEAALRLPVIADLKAPIALRRPVPKALVRGDGHLLAKDVHHDAQRVVRWLVKALKDRRTNLERVLAALMHAGECVRGASWLDV